MGDELKAAGRAVSDAYHGGSFKEAYPRYLEAYPHYLAAEREQLDDYRKENPGTALAAEVAGNVAGMAIPASRLLGVARFVPEAATVGQAVMRGLLYGGAKGFYREQATRRAIGAIVFREVHPVSFRA